MSTQIKIVTALCVCAPALAAQQSGVYDFTHARAVIDSIMAADKIPSFAVAVAKGQRIIWEAARGFADVERQIPATPTTPYSLASISKPFTATGIMILVQREFVRLRAPVNHYLGGVKVTAREGTADAVTIERILTHTAGLPLHYQFFYEDGGYARPPMDSTIRRYGVAVYPPGATYQYSNLGFGILDYVISRKSAMPYADFMRREVFMPMGLTSTSVGMTYGPINRAAVRYDNDNKPLPYYTFDHPGASEIYSSARDLARFGMFHLGVRMPGQRQILARETLQDMQRDVAVEGPGLTRGLGWSVRTVLGVRRVSHSGGMPGVSTFLALYPEEQVVVVVLQNKAIRRATEAIVTELSATVIPRFASQLRKARASTPPAPAPVVDSVRLAELHGTWRGFVYSYADSIPITLTMAAATPPFVSLGGAAPVPLTSLTLQEGILFGRADVQMSAAAPDLVRHPHQTILWLRAHDDLLSGYAAAESTAPRAYYALSSYAKLERVPR